MWWPNNRPRNRPQSAAGHKSTSDHFLRAKEQKYLGIRVPTFRAHMTTLILRCAKEQLRETSARQELKRLLKLAEQLHHAIHKPDPLWCLPALAKNSCVSEG